MAFGCVLGEKIIDVVDGQAVGNEQKGLKIALGFLP